MCRSLRINKVCIPRLHYLNIVKRDGHKKQHVYVYQFLKINTPFYHEDHAYTAWSYTVLDLPICDDITVRHRETFCNDRGLLKYIYLNFSLSCSFIIEYSLPVQKWSFFKTHSYKSFRPMKRVWLNGIPIFGEA